MSVKVSNPIDRVYTNFTINYGNTIRDTQIVSSPPILLENNFGWLNISWSAIPPDACICIGFGNGTNLIYGPNVACTNCSLYTYTDIKPKNNSIKIPILFTKKANYIINVSTYIGRESVHADHTVFVTSASDPRDTDNNNPNISIRNMQIATNSQRLYPQNYGWLYITWSAIPQDACICVNFANGTNLIYGAISGCVNCSSNTYTNIQPVNNILQILLRYTKEADYNITVYTYKGLESVHSHLIVPVTYIRCSPPIVSISSSKYLHSHPLRTESRSSKIIISAEVTDIPCQVTKSNFKLWTAIMVDPRTLSPMKDVNLAAIPTSTESYLVIPPLFLDYGLYLLTCTVTMDKNVTIHTFQSYNQTYLQITKSPITVRLSSGGISMITRGLDEMICFTPKVYSMDPDLKVQVGINFFKLEFLSKVDL